MIPLHRLLKKKVLAPVLDEARVLLGAGWHLTVSEGPCPEAPGSGGYVEPLRLDGAVVGYLNLTPLSDAGCDRAALPAGLPERLEDHPAAKLVWRATDID